MSTRFQAAKITDTVYWVGAIDSSTRDFHGYLTQRGTTYNAYLVMADKITLIDTVKAPFRDELFARIASVVDPKNISYIISNHAEMDHSGCLPEAVELIQPEKVFASVKGVKALNAHFRGGLDLIPLKTGDTVSLGNRSLAFIETPMLHWPDSMFSYLPDERVLFSNDAFGMHLASSKRFADEIDPFVLKFEGEKYYANIILPYSNLVLKLLDKVAADGPSVDMILPDHGPVWRRAGDIAEVLARYRSWATQAPCRKAMIVYDTMWQSTEQMARVIAEGIADAGVEVNLRSLKANHRSDIAKDILDCGALVVGSPTINNGIFPTMADVMSYLRGLKPRNLVGAAFGSYGWSGESIGLLEGYLKDMGVELAGESVSVQFVPDADTLDRCYNLGRSVAETLNVKCDN
jgi:flavorubredoxin